MSSGPPMGTDGTVEPISTVGRAPVSATRSLRVLHCIHTLVGGGAERQLGWLLKASAAHDMTAAVCCLEPGGAAPPGVALFTQSRRHRYDPVAFGLVRRAINQFRPDIVHAWLPPSTTIPAMLMSGVMGIPVLFSFLSAMRFRRPLAIAEYAIAWVCASGLIANSPAENASPAYRALFRRKRGAVILNGVNLPSEIRKTVYRAPADGPLRMLFVGRLVGAKNWSCLIRALPLIDRRVDWRLELCGEGPDRIAAEHLVRTLALEERVRFVGFQSDVYVRMQQADLLLMPSLWEGLPNALLEAFAIGLPCIASDIPAHRLLVGNADCLTYFDPRSPAALAGAISAVAQQYGAAVARTAAARAIADRLDVDGMARRYLDYYRLLLGAGNA